MCHVTAKVEFRSHFVISALCTAVVSFPQKLLFKSAAYCSIVPRDFSPPSAVAVPSSTPPPSLSFHSWPFWQQAAEGQERAATTTTKKRKQAEKEKIITNLKEERHLTGLSQVGDPVKKRESCGAALRILKDRSAGQFLVSLRFLNLKSQTPKHHVRLESPA